MLSTKRSLIRSAIYAVSGIIFIVVSYFLVTSGSFLFAFISGTLILSLLLIATDSLVSYFIKRAEKSVYEGNENSILYEFSECIRTSYSTDDFIQSAQNVCEDKGDISILYVNRENNYIVYNSPDRITFSENTSHTLEMHFPGTWENGVYFFDNELGILSDIRKARGFFMVSGTMHMYFFCRYSRYLEPELLERLFEEYLRFERRSHIILSMSQIAELATEWDMLAKTQRSFLPAKMPDIKGIELAAYFRPLVNVSGDYYTVLPVNEHKTLVMLGDVSGKGLAAALVMGLVINIVKIMDDKEDLVGIVKAIDTGIKRMHLQDKYTVLFIALIDTNLMKIRYINASMSDPIIVTRAPDGFRIKPLSSNCGVVGIIELDDVHIEEKRLFRDDLILMASDGVSEVMDENGIELGDTELYMQTIQNSAYKSAHHFVQDIADLVLSYNGDKKLRDDVTMLAVKVEG